MGHHLNALSRTARAEHVELLSALAAVTERIGLIATAATTYNDPYHIARKFASLDHLSHGRADWNLVTSVVSDKAWNFGRERHVDHAARYRRTAEDFAHAGGGGAELQVIDNAPATVNDLALARRVTPPLQRAVGADNVVEMPLVTVAEDFSQFANAAPGAYFFVGTTPADQDPATMPINHSPKYAPDEAAPDVGSRAMLWQRPRRAEVVQSR